MRMLYRGHHPASLLAAGIAEFEAARLHFDGTGRRSGFVYKAYGEADVKSALTAMSNGKCAYCEADYDATQPSDVEHFRPKGAIDTDVGRIKPGYWWLAATWENLLPSCIRCNRKEKQLLFDGTELSCGKANSFPLADETRRAAAVGQEAHEDPLLIDPCREDPAVHLRFVDDKGHCVAVPVDPDPLSGSGRRARTSIDVFGLNRAGLVRDRSRYMRWAKISLARLERLARRLDVLPADADGDREEIAEMIDQELDYLDGLTCGEDRYTGMLRALVDPKLAELNMAL
ncbi:hypothetical protein ACIQUG_32190 [Ensifer sp. NPDC090286]|uniref:hypothetical protein n=1 Tax=Ensifer sp. NPDC090286 TaxID=3363991 RepID=UPI00383B39DD